MPILLIPWPRSRIRTICLIGDMEFGFPAIPIRF